MPSGVSVAGLGRRFVAALIDALPIGAISGGRADRDLARPSATNMIVLSIVGVVLSLARSLYLWWATQQGAPAPGPEPWASRCSLTDGPSGRLGRYFCASWCGRRRGVRAAVDRPRRDD
jgi:hypothetical protein